MAELKLAKLPDRTPLKLTISVLPDLNQRLSEYAALYGQVYGKDEPIVELVPAMLTAFLDSDREFARYRQVTPRP